MEGICEALTDELNELQQQIHLKNQLLKQKQQQQQQQGKRRTIQHDQVQSAQHGLFEFCRVLPQIPWAHVCYERFPPSFKHRSWKLVKLKLANMCTQPHIHCLYDHFNVWTTLTLLHLNKYCKKSLLQFWLSKRSYGCHKKLSFCLLVSILSPELLLPFTRGMGNGCSGRISACIVGI